MLYKKMCVFLINFILIVANVIGVQPLSVSNFESSALQNSSYEYDDYKSEISRTEIISQRTASSKTFSNADGTNSFVAYAYDIHYLDKNGKYQEIDTTIIENKREDFLYSNAANAWDVSFAKDKLEITYNNNTIMMSFPEAVAVDLLKNRNCSEFAYYQQKGNASNSIIYDYRGYSIIYTVLNGSLKEDIVIEQEDAIQDFSFEIMFGENMKLIDEEGLRLVDLDGNSIFEIADLVMYDAKGKESNAVVLKAAQIENGVSLVVSADSSFFNDEIVYPVIIDPTINVIGATSSYDSYVDEQNPYSNYYLSQYLLTGGEEGVNCTRSFIKFTLPTNIIGSQITRARILIKKNAYSTPTIQAFRVTEEWAPNGVTWDDQPEFDDTGYSSQAVSMGSDWYNLNVTGLVVGYKMMYYPYYGFVLREYYENNSSKRTRFYSSDASTSNSPMLCIDYVNNLGSRPYQATSTLNANCMGYALDIKQKINSSNMGYSRNDLNGKTLGELLAFFRSKAENWMNSASGLNGNYSVLAAYDSNISTTSPGWYRVALRVGFDDYDNDGVLDADEPWDFHWWYQTNSLYGCWADKHGTYPSELLPGTNGIDPQDQDWGIDIYVYNSDCVYYQIKDVRSPSW